MTMGNISRNSIDVQGGSTPTRRLIKTAPKRLPSPIPDDLLNAMVERGVEILRKDPKRSELQMRLRLAKEFNFNDRDLVCVEAAAGSEFHQRYVAPFRKGQQ